jgi:hypothetical protein
LAKPNPEALRRRRHYQLGAGAVAASLVISLAQSFSWLPSPGAGSDARVGDVAQVPIKAPADLSIVDREATEQERLAALAAAPAIYDYNDSSEQEIRARYTAAFAAAQAAREPAPVPIGPQVAPAVAPPASPPAPAVPPAPAPAVTPAEAFRNALGVDLPADIIGRLIDDPAVSAEVVERWLPRVMRPLRGMRILEDTELARRLEQRQPIEETIRSSRVRVPLPDVSKIRSATEAVEIVRSTEAEVLDDEPRALRNAVIGLATALIRPNLTFNQLSTDERRKAAQESVGEVTIKLRKGEIIVRDGDVLNARHVRILRGIAEQTDIRGQIEAFIGAFTITMLALVITWRVAVTGIPRFAREPRDGAFLLTVLAITALGLKLGVFICDAIASTPSLALVRDSGAQLYYLFPVAGATLLVRLVHNVETSALFAVVSALFAALQMGGELSYAFYVLGGSLAAALGATRVTQRGTLLRVGVRVGGVNAAIAAGLLVLGHNVAPIPVLVALASAFVSGCLAGGLAIALAPLVESVFSYTTDVKLLELANREQPVLRELELRAPGTYHHSMMVGHLAEKAAETIGANPLLAKVAGYYHDIGKMKRPHFFVENITIHQGENRHEKLAPSMSARVIQAHVKDGLEIGAKHHLAPAIMRGIGEHHGTSVIRFFYEKAKELADPEKGESVREHDYRYAGPKPQTREAGILMLADSVEAASRTLADTSPARIQQLVERTINHYFRDGQLDECSLTLRDLHAIARSFHDTLSAIRHERIDYPDKTDAQGRKLEEPTDESVVERLEPRARDRAERASANRQDDLKRLGLPGR